MARIEDYEFGRIVVDGEVETRDLVILPDRVVRNWWRKEGHSLVPEDLADVLEDLPPRLLVGTGAEGRLLPNPDLAEFLRRHGVEMVAVPTAEAVREYRRSDPGSTAAALHLTC